MANTSRQIVQRIRTAQSISKITRAMEMVSASKMRRAQGRALAGMTFSRQLAHTLLRLTDKIEGNAHPLLVSNPEAGKTLFVIFSTDKGLTGGLNTNLFNFVEHRSSSDGRALVSKTSCREFDSLLLC